MPICNKIVPLVPLLFFSQSLFSAEKYAPTSVDMPVKKVSEHVYYVEGAPGIATDNEGFISNAGFVITGDGVVVFAVGRRRRDRRPGICRSSAGDGNRDAEPVGPGSGRLLRSPQRFSPR